MPISTDPIVIPASEEQTFDIVWFSLINANVVPVPNQPAYSGSLRLVRQVMNSSGVLHPTELQTIDISSDELMEALSACPKAAAIFGPLAEASEELTQWKLAKLSQNAQA